MPSVKILDTEKLRARRIIATATLTALAAAFLLLSTRKAPLSATLPARGPSHQAAEKQAPPDGREAAQTAAVQAPMELEAMELEPMELAGLAVVDTPNDAPVEQVVPARLEPRPAANTSPPGSEQPLYKSRRALETIDPREFLRHATVAR